MDLDLWSMQKPNRMFDAFRLLYTQFYYMLHYRKIYGIRRTKSQQLSASRPVLQLSLPNPLKPGVKSRKKM